MNESFTVTAKLCCWCFNVSQETVAHQRLLTESKRGLFPPIIHSFIHIHRVVPKRLFSYPLSAPGLTMATHPRAGTLSLTAERWLNNGELRFCSRNACTCWITLDTGCRRVVKTA